MRTRTILTATALLVISAFLAWPSTSGRRSLALAQEKAPAAQAPQLESAKETASSPERFERSVKEVGKRVTSAIVHIKGSNGKIRDGVPGVIVSAEGHVLMQALPSDFKLMVHLSDGRTAPCKALGASREWGVSLAKLEGDGPWPYVNPQELAEVQAGQSVITFGYADSEENIVRRPLLDVEQVEWCVPGQWFTLHVGSKLEWKKAGIAFDLQGRLVGIEGIGYPAIGAAAFSHVRRVQAIWSELKEGKNVDRLRLSSDKATLSEPRLPTSAKVNSEISAEAQSKAIAATVQIRRNPGAKGFSGVIISADGMVATCGHHYMLPGSKVTISLPDGRDVAAEVIGISFPTDIGLVRILEPGPFPFVERGDSTKLGPGDACIGIGYGPVDAKARKPDVRKLSIVKREDGSWTHELPSDPVEWAGGDCGGGVFDAQGQLVAILLPGTEIPNGHKRIELLRAQWSDLQASFTSISKPELESKLDKIRPSDSHIQSCTVELLDGDKTVALGAMVSASGKLITKASVVPQLPSCRLADGRVLPAKILKVIREWDVAILKIDAKDLPVIKWSKGETLPLGTLVGLAAKSSAMGFINHPPLSFPAESGWPNAALRDAEGGVEVEEIRDYPSGPRVANFTPRPLQKGDIILSVEGRPTPNFKVLLEMLDVKQPKPLAFAGDLVHLVVRRNTEQLEFDTVLMPPTFPRAAGQSARSSGFASVYNVSANTDFNLCGGPAYNRDGLAIGIVIASRQPGWLLVLPAETAQRIVSD